MVPNRLLVVLRVVLLLLWDILLLQGVLLPLRGILLLQEILLLGIFSLVDRLVGVKWVVVLAAVPALRLVGRVCLALVLVVELPRLRVFVLYVRFVGGFPLLLRVRGGRPPQLLLLLVPSWWSFLVG